MQEFDNLCTSGRESVDGQVPFVALKRRAEILGVKLKFVEPVLTKGADVDPIAICGHANLKAALEQVDVQFEGPYAISITVHKIGRTGDTFGIYTSGGGVDASVDLIDIHRRQDAGGFEIGTLHATMKKDWSVVAKNWSPCGPPPGTGSRGTPCMSLTS